MRALKAFKPSPPREIPAVLDEAYIHLTAGRHSTKSLARALGLSIATAFRVVKALRRRGLRIESMKEGREWFFSIQEDDALEATWKHDPLLRLIGAARGPGRRGKTVDEAVYGRR